jgi:hypothetical protein
MRSMPTVPLLGGYSDRLTGEVLAQNGFVFVGMDVRQEPWVADAQAEHGVPVMTEKPSKTGGALEVGGRLDLGFWYYQPVKVWSAMMVADFTQQTPVVREPVGIPGGLVAVANVGQAGGIVVAVDASNQEVSTLVYDGVACWTYKDAVLHGRAGLMAAGLGTVCRAITDEAALEARLEAFRYEKPQQHFVRADLWSASGVEPTLLRVRDSQVFMGLLSDGKWEFRLADLGAGSQFENRRKVAMPANNDTLALECAVGDQQGAGLWVPQGLYGVAYFPALPVLVPQGMREPPPVLLSVPVEGAPETTVWGPQLIGPLR